MLGKVILTTIWCSSIHVYERDGEFKHSGDVLLIYDTIILYFTVKKMAQV